jgi:hypothetical protein
MPPLYLARVEDLGRGDLVQVDCAACHHVSAADTGLLAAVRARPQREGPRPKVAGPLPRVRSEGAGRRFGQVGASGRVSPACPGISERAAPVCAYFARRKSATKP